MEVLADEEYREPQLFHACDQGHGADPHRRGYVASFPSEGNLSVPVQESAKSHNPGAYGERLYVQTRIARRSYFKT